MSFAKRKKWAIVSILLVVAIIAIRIGWLYNLTTYDYHEQPKAKEGLLDLREWDHSTSKTLRLDGEWAFYPSQSVTDLNEAAKQYRQVPRRSQTQLNQSEDPQYSIQSGTYRLRILLNEEDEQIFGIRINEVRNALVVYVNSAFVNYIGNPAYYASAEKMSNIPTTIELVPENGEVDLVVHVANSASTGSIAKSIRFGTIEAIDKRVALSNQLQLLLAVFLLIHSFYALLLYILGGKSKGLLYFSIMMILGVGSVLTADDKLLFSWFQIEYGWSLKIVHLIYIGVMVCMPLLFQHLFPSNLSQKYFYRFMMIVGVYTLFIVLAPVQMILSLGALLGLVMMISVILSAFILWKAIPSEKDAIYLLIASLIMGVNIGWVIILKNFSAEYMHYPFDIMFALFAFSAFWLRRFFRAIEETKSLSKKLQVEDKRKDTFLINTSHELRNPLHGMMNLTQTMLNDGQEPLSMKQKERLALHLQISKHMSLLVEDLLDITRLKEKRIQLTWQNISFPSVVTGVMDMMKPSVEDKKVAILLAINDDFPLLWGDEQRFVQIMFNLLHNAVKFTEQGAITIRATVEGHLARIEVEDTGIGIREEIINTIFEPYEQGGTDETNLVEGLGLGLTICKNLVELHGGTIYVESIVGQGSIFSLTFPLAKEKNSVISLSNHQSSTEDLTCQIENIETSLLDEEAVDQEGLSKTKSNILIVDDDPMNLQVIQNLLEIDSYHVTTATDAKKALAVLKKEPIDLVISDVMMPNISGYELTRQIRKQYSLAQLPILLVTARTRSEDVLVGFTAGANDYITKPVDALELKARVHALTSLKIALEEHVRLESAWLQSQIQPHFIFNVLNTIASFGITDVQKMQALLEEFSNYLRLSFDFKNADPVVPLEHELALVRSYIYIEQQRFGERLQVEWSIEPHINLFVPPLSIQPLVENAIKHGLFSSPGNGTVRIDINKTETHYEIIVSDNGRGMTEERVATLVEQLEKGTEKISTRVGLRNINLRLKQLYDENLIVESTPSIGTTVRFMIPIPLANLRF